jgi:hypothetical protein
VSCRVESLLAARYSLHLISRQTQVTLAFLHRSIVAYYHYTHLTSTTRCTLSTSTDPPHSHHLRSLESSRPSLRLMPCLVILLPISSLEDGDRLHRICSHHPCGLAASHSAPAHGLTAARGTPTPPVSHPQPTTWTCDVNCHCDLLHSLHYHQLYIHLLPLLHKPLQSAALPEH